MYEKHFGFTIKPFQTIPNPEFFYQSPKHENALSYLEYGIMEKAGFVLLTGEVGSGKTTLIRYLLNKIESEIETAVILNTNVTAEQLIEMILNEFEITAPEKGKARTLDALFKYLIDMFARNRRVLLIIDEAQNLDREALEEVRMLSNLQSDDQCLLQIMLVGQPELSSKLMSPELAQLNQRISVAYHIPALSRQETGEYVAYRLEKAGGKPEIFTKDALELIFKASGGIPRTINIICDTTLVYAFSDELQVIDKKLIEQVLHDREGTGLSLKKKKSMHRKKMEQGGDDLIKRLEALEMGLSRLQMQVDIRIDAVEKLAAGKRDEVLTRIRELYDAERERNSELLAEYHKLMNEYQSLKECNDRKTEIGMQVIKAQRACGDDGGIDSGEASIPTDQSSMANEEFLAKRDNVKKEMEDVIRDLMQKDVTGKNTAQKRHQDKKKGIMNWFKD